MSDYIKPTSQKTVIFRVTAVKPRTSCSTQNMELERSSDIRYLHIRLHAIISQTTVIFIVIAVWTSDLAIYPGNDDNHVPLKH
jgi:hypothetical protein